MFSCPRGAYGQGECICIGDVDELCDRLIRLVERLEDEGHHVDASLVWRAYHAIHHATTESSK
jgi:hypothetical protein